MMPVVTANTAVSAGRPPRFSTMPIAIGVVTDFGAIDSRVRSTRPAPTRCRPRRRGRHGAGQQRGGDRPSACLQLAHCATAAPRGPRGGAQQEVHELRAVEVRLVRRAGQRHSATSSTTERARGSAAGACRRAGRPSPPPWYITSVSVRPSSGVAARYTQISASGARHRRRPRLAAREQRAHARAVAAMARSVLSDERDRDRQPLVRRAGEVEHHADAGRHEQQRQVWQQTVGGCRRSRRRGRARCNVANSSAMPTTGPRDRQPQTRRRRPRPPVDRRAGR